MGKAKINAQIQSVQKNKMNMFRNLGELVYNLHINGVISIEQCEGMCNEITSYNDTIAELQKLAEEIEMKKNAPVYETETGTGEVCPICATVNPQGANFCAVCGGQIPVALTENEMQEKSRVSCENCGALNDENAKFCENCGYAMATVETDVYVSETKNIICANCKTENIPDARFCAGCGHDLTADYTSTEVFYTSKDDTPAGSVCPNCLTNNEVDARFCATCGTQLV